VKQPMVKRGPKSRRQTRGQRDPNAPTDARNEPGETRRRARDHVPTTAEIWKGTNRIVAGRLQHISHILQIPVAFFFDGSPHGEAPSPAYVSDLLTTAAGLALVEAFIRIREPTVRQRIVKLVRDDST
jgi:hypothetical protein